MSAKIIWSPRAQRSFDSLVSFLEKKWEKKVIQNLFEEVHEVLIHISRNPEIYPICSTQKILRKCVIKRRTLMLYRVIHNNIEIVVFADGRQHPKKYLH